ncbi:MAG: hypothetical protein V4795_19265 [Pseudomonadota bacterium]
MLRTLALVLLLANALLLAALSGAFDSGGDSAREPERLQRQHQPGLVRILGPQAASAALDAASQAAAAASNALATSCLEAGPFSAADAGSAERSLREAGLPADGWQVRRQDDAGAFMVYMGRYADRETLQRKLAEVRRLKLEPEDLRDAPELQPGISLGRFDSQDSANAAMAQMAQRGLRTARVITLRQAQSQTVLRVPAADAALRARLAGLQLPSGPGFLPCVAGEAAASPAAGAASAAAAPAAPAAASSGPSVAAAAAASATPAATPAAKPSAPPAAAAAAPRPATPAASRPAPAPAPAATAPARPAPGSATQAPAASSSAAAPATRVSGADTRAALARAATAAAAEAAASAAAR